MIINTKAKLDNAFGIDSTSDYLLMINSENCIQDLDNFLTANIQKKLVVGEATNIILPNHFKGIVIKNNLTNLIKHSKNEVEVGAGVNWHEFVDWTIENNFYGLENLTLIPGSVGAAPIQNIGAYGVEVSQFISKVRFYDFTDKQIKVFNNKECNFSYRKSIFQKMDILILSVNFIFTLNKLFTNYESIENYLNYNNIDLKDLTPKKLAKYIQEIRLSKLPDYKKLPNVGSFFKNPILDKNEYRLIHAKNKKLISWDYNRDLVKVGAARLIELIKDKLPKNLEVDIYDNHALVLINKKNANQEDVINFSSLIKNEVFKHFKIDLEIEPIIIKS
jgi:UDP-N-acetylmuramate dehydrogenase